MHPTPSNRHLRVVVLGAGMSGILCGIKLREAGYTNVSIYEKASRPGGTWRENTYPGLTCDVPSHAYTYSFEPNPDWSHQLPPGAEVQDYFERTVKKYKVDELIRFDQEVTRCEFVDGRWHLETKNGLRDEADVVIAATGVLHHPRYPDIPGLKTFEGSLLHSARWDHSVALDGKRIGIVGNGSTGVQLVSALARRASKLKHFQRTAQWIMPVENPAFTEAQKQALRDDPALLKRMQNDETYMANVERFTTAVANAESPEMAAIEAIVRENLERSVQDPVLREQLRPNYRAACKRLIFSPDYYQAIQHPNAALVTDGIETITPNGVLTRDGKLHELDVIVLASGFHADRFMRPMQVIGRHGKSLNDAWAKRPNAYLAVAIPQFPNFFMLNGPTSPVGNFSLIDVAENQWGYIAQLLEPLSSGECREITVTQAALDEYEQARLAAAKNTIFGSGCNSWYLDAEGVPATWPWNYERFRNAMKAPKLDAFEMRK
ncbi:4-hydroxyacetophenone monooxygenase [Pandoraea terrae]|uniref:4-hydroxyacetophenone monooxygenase n=1 Tax=Pandoraea terrae TaxID=1537710 RepID=A0A5E4WHQ7_9BURK|nr:NAD(P)/FAD-dependent oxidoreductase [Pandoraea terrae]VVE23359.1 4-hydroxyacetophenone monooxygenase [Pandoraea terrae]